MSNIVSIQFLKNYSVYHIGQIAGFPQEFADRLVSSGAAKPFIKQVVPEKRSVLKKMVSKKN